MSDSSNAAGSSMRSELEEILAQLSDARSVLECGTRLLECGDGSAGRRHLDEAVCLRQGIILLGAVYDSLDRATSR